MRCPNCNGRLDLFETHTVKGLQLIVGCRRCGLIAPKAEVADTTNEVSASRQKATRKRAEPL